MEILLATCALIVTIMMVKIAFFDANTAYDYSRIRRVENKDHKLGELDEYVHVEVVLKDRVIDLLFTQKEYEEGLKRADKNIEDLL